MLPHIFNAQVYIPQDYLATNLVLLIVTLKGIPVNSTDLSSTLLISDPKIAVY